MFGVDSDKTKRADLVGLDVARPGKSNTNSLCLCRSRDAMTCDIDIADAQFIAHQPNFCAKIVPRIQYMDISEEGRKKKQKGGHCSPL